MKMIHRVFLAQNAVCLVAILAGLLNVSAQKRPSGAPPPCTPAPAGLVSWWSFDEASGVAAKDRRARNDGTILGTTTISAGGKVGAAFTFDSTDDGVSVPDTSTLDFGVNQDFSVDAWINADVAGGNIMTFLDKRDTSGPVIGYALSLANGNLVFQLADGGFTNFSVGGADLRDGQWHHVAVTIDRDNEMAFYVDGAQIGTTNPVTRSGDLSNSAPFLVGMHADTPAFFFDGSIDELEVFNRALSPTEVAAIYTADTSGKCKPTATVAPANLFAWIPGDGNATDISGNGNNGTVMGNTNYAVGNVGQAFNFSSGASDVVSLGSLTGFNYAGSLTVETWIRPNFVSGFTAIVAKWGQNFVSCGVATTADSFALYVSNGQLFGVIHQPSGGEPVLQGGSILPNVYSHVAMTYNQATGAMAIYVNGVVAGSGTVATNGICNSNKNVFIGGEDSGIPRRFNGRIDETAIYSRALSQTEIQSIVSAGVAGKLKTATTPAGFAGRVVSKETSPVPQNPSPEVVSVTIGDATLIFPTVTAAGVAHSIPLNTSVLPSLPGGHAHTGLAYDIATTAVYTGTVTGCFNLPAFAALPQAEFNERRILHLESGIWVNRTHSYDFSNKMICARMPSLSPFAIVDSNLAPSTANVTIGGRVFDESGRGLMNAVVYLTDGSGAVLMTRTSSLGYYRFDEIPAGQTIIVAVRSKRYQFSPRIVTISEELNDLDFAPS